MDVKNRISIRAWRIAREIVEELNIMGIKQFYIGGNSLNVESIDDVNDVDLFPVEGRFKIEWETSHILSDTRNATTVDFITVVVQFCNYEHESLEDLVNSFDFSHIQVGAKVLLDGNRVTVQKVYHTDAWLQSRALGVTEFVGSEYPLASLMREGKYYARGWGERRDHIGNVLKILAAIKKRGFKNYEDFKDQLDAVDLGLLPEDMSEIEWESLYCIAQIGGLDVSRRLKEENNDTTSSSDGSADSSSDTPPF